MYELSLRDASSMKGTGLSGSETYDDTEDSYEDSSKESDESFVR